MDLNIFDHNQQFRFTDSKYTEAYPAYNTNYSGNMSEQTNRSSQFMMRNFDDEGDQLSHLSQSNSSSLIQESCYSLSQRRKKSRNTKKKKKPQILRKTNFTVADDLRLLNLVKAMGPKFNQFAKLFPGKSLNCIKNRYYKVIRQRREELMAMQIHPSKSNLINQMEQVGLCPEIESIVSTFMVDLSSVFERTLDQ